MKKNTVSKTLKSPRTDFKINNFFEKGSFFETSSDFLILKPKADDITGTPLIFAFRLQTYVLDFSASLNDINISSFMVPVYLLKSGFQPQKHKRLVFDRTSQRFAISLLFACLKLTRNRLFCYFCPSFVLGVGSGNNKDISFSNRSHKTACSFSSTTREADIRYTINTSSTGQVDFKRLACLSLELLTINTSLQTVFFDKKK